MTKKVLTAFFSVGGVTKNVAELVNKTANGDLFEIEPITPYSKEDLDWSDINSRSSVEMKGGTNRPKIKNKVADIKKYDTILVGFPIWWNTMPTIVNSFLEEYDLKGKRIIAFFTAGSVGPFQVLEKIKPSAKGANVDGVYRIYNNREDFIKEWVESLKL